jgi:hypothetical protein|tara:strand:- start:402 stop:785 length:384 start_codon:yes stop_codon:yes gene_type:complete
MLTGEEFNNAMEKREVQKTEELDEFAKLRAEVRTKVLADALIIGKHGTEFVATFNGYGDSGDVSVHTGVNAINEFLSEAIYKFVDFDWYNNDGGGGDITWDLKTDIITINGYSNFTETHDEMTEEVF